MYLNNSYITLILECFDLMMCPYESYTGSLCENNGKRVRKDYHSIICEKAPIVSIGCKIGTV